MNSIDDLLCHVRKWRLISVLLLVAMLNLGYEVWHWFSTIPSPTNSQGAFASAVVLAVVGIAKFWMESSATEHPPKSDS